MQHDEWDFLPLRVIRVSSNGRRIYDPEGKRKLIALCRQSNTRVLQLARNAGIKAKQRHNWLAQDNSRSVQPASNSAFVPVVAMASDEHCSQLAVSVNRPDTPMDQTNPSPIRLSAT